MATTSPDVLAKEQFSGINQLSFFDPQYNKEFVGNGFLINYQNKTYAVTVKHALLEAKTPTLTHVDTKEHIKEWRIHPNQSSDKYVKLGRLINSNDQEKIDMAILQKDWLVFDVLENRSSLSVLTLRDTPLEKGEKVTAYGCSYANKSMCTQDIYQGTYLAKEAQNLRIAMPTLELNKLRGLSGSPVLDSQNRVVGIVSNVLKSKSGKGFDFAPASIDYLQQVLSTIKG